MEKIVDGYVYYTLRGINNAIRDKKNAHKTINSIVSDAIEDIDNRLNKPPKIKIRGSSFISTLRNPN